MSEPVQNDYRLLLDLDALFDSRFGTLLKLDRDAAHLAVRNGYQIRDWDNMEALTEGKITNDQFDKAYAARNRETLQKSIITGIPHVLVMYINQLQDRFLRRVNVSTITITLNTFPYQLPGPDIQAMVEALGVIIPEHVKINAVRVNLQKLDPDNLKASFDAWCTYDFDAWLKIHQEALLFKRANSVTVILPQRHLSAPEQYELADDEDLNKLDKCSLLAMVMEEFIHLEFLPIGDFCFFTPGNYSSSSPSSSSSASGSATKSP